MYELKLSESEIETLISGLKSNIIALSDFYNDDKNKNIKPEINERIIANEYLKIRLETILNG
jgi:hypothetical protein